MSLYVSQRQRESKGRVSSDLYYAVVGTSGHAYGIRKSISWQYLPPAIGNTAPLSWHCTLPHHGAEVLQLLESIHGVAKLHNSQAHDRHQLQSDCCYDCCRWQQGDPLPCAWCFQSCPWRSRWSVTCGPQNGPKNRLVGLGKYLVTRVAALHNRSTACALHGPHRPFICFGCPGTGR